MKMGLKNYGKLFPDWLRKPLRFVRRAMGAPGDWLCCVLQGVKWRFDWKLNGWVYFRRSLGARLEIGKRFTANSNPRENAIGVFQPVIFTVIGDNALISLGDDVGVSGCSITAVSEIHIGNRVLIGSGALIVDNDGHPLDPQERRRGAGIIGSPIRIDDDVFIGARAIILKGVHIHEGAVVGAGAVVARDVPAFAIAVGNPMRIVGDSRRPSPGETSQPRQGTASN
jgi:acetyltransferase-like isoleucine patch superfamily enzyme